MIKTLATLLAFASMAHGQASPDQKTVWNGVYSAPQAVRGQAEYEANCMGCHKTGESAVNPDSRLKGPNFMERWREDTLESLFVLIKATMPRAKPGSLSDKTYIDVISFLLRENGFPAGANELTDATLPTVRIELKDGPKPLPSGALVRIVGCLVDQQTPTQRTWLIANGTEPARTRRAKDSTPQEIESGRSQQLGNQTFRLQNIDFVTQLLKVNLNAHQGKKILAKGYVIRQTRGQRLDITAFEPLGAPCAQQ